jgi:O-antigen/teichoic acid export membrane protein
VTDGGTTLARATFLGLRADIVTAISAVVLSVLVARGLGPENRGIFFLAFLVATLVVVVGDLGMSAATISYSANREISAGRLQTIAVLFALGATAFAAVLLLPFQDFWTDSVLKGLDETMMLLLVAGVGPQLFGQISAALLAGSGRIPALSWIRIGYALATPVLVGVAAVATGDPAWTLAGWLAATIGYAVALEIYVVRAVSPPSVPSASDVRKVLGFGLRGYFGTMAHHGFLRVDVLFLSARYGPRLVGIYSLASLIAERISLLGQAVYGASAAPLGSLPRPEAARLAADVLRLMLAVLIPAGIVAAVLAFPLIPLIFGEGFSDAALPLVLLLPGTVALTCWYLIALYIISTLRRPGTTTLIQAGALLVSLPLYYVAVREWEMTGAAVVSSAVYVSVMAMGAVVLCRSSAVRPLELLPRPADAGRVLDFARSSLGGSRG